MRARPPPPLSARASMRRQSHKPRNNGAAGHDVTQVPAGAPRPPRRPMPKRMTAPPLGQTPAVPRGLQPPRALSSRSSQAPPRGPHPRGTMPRGQSPRGLQMPSADNIAKGKPARSPPRGHQNSSSARERRSHMATDGAIWHKPAMARSGSSGSLASKNTGAVVTPEERQGVSVTKYRDELVISAVGTEVDAAGADLEPNCDVSDGDTQSDTVSVGLLRGESLRLARHKEHMKQRSTYHARSNVAMPTRNSRLHDDVMHMSAQEEPTVVSLSVFAAARALRLLQKRAASETARAIQAVLNDTVVNDAGVVEAHVQAFAELPSRWAHGAALAALRSAALAGEGTESADSTTAMSDALSHTMTLLLGWLPARAQDHADQEFASGSVQAFARRFGLDNKESTDDEGETRSRIQQSELLPMSFDLFILEVASAYASLDTSSSAQGAAKDSGTTSTSANKRNFQAMLTADVCLAELLETIVEHSFVELLLLLADDVYAVHVSEAPVGGKVVQRLSRQVARQLRRRAMAAVVSAATTEVAPPPQIRTAPKRRQGWRSTHRNERCLETTGTMSELSDDPALVRRRSRIASQATVAGRRRVAELWSVALGLLCKVSSGDAASLSLPLLPVLTYELLRRLSAIACGSLRLAVGGCNDVIASEVEAAVQESEQYSVYSTKPDANSNAFVSSQRTGGTATRLDLSFSSCTERFVLAFESAKAGAASNIALSHSCTTVAESLWRVARFLRFRPYNIPLHRSLLVLVLEEQRRWLSFEARATGLGASLKRILSSSAARELNARDSGDVVVNGLSAAADEEGASALEQSSPEKVVTSALAAPPMRALVLASARCVLATLDIPAKCDAIDNDLHSVTAAIERMYLALDTLSPRKSQLRGIDGVGAAVNCLMASLLARSSQAFYDEHIEVFLRKRLMKRVTAGPEPGPELIFSRGYKHQDFTHTVPDLHGAAEPSLFRSALRATLLLLRGPAARGGDATGSDTGNPGEWNEWNGNAPGDAADLSPGSFGSPYAWLACRDKYSTFPMPTEPLSMILAKTSQKPAAYPVPSHALSCTMRRFSAGPQTTLFRADQFGWIRDALFDSQRAKLLGDVDAISVATTQHNRLSDVAGGAAPICSSLLGDIGEVLLQMCANQLFDWDWGETARARSNDHDSTKTVRTEHSSGFVLVRHSHRQIVSGGEDEVTGTSESKCTRTKWRSHFDTPIAILYWLLGSTHVGSATAAAANLNSKSKSSLRSFLPARGARRIPASMPPPPHSSDHYMLLGLNVAASILDTRGAFQRHARRHGSWEEEMDALRLVVQMAIQRCHSHVVNSTRAIARDEDGMGFVGTARDCVSYRRHYHSDWARERIWDSSSSMNETDNSKLGNHTISHWEEAREAELAAGGHADDFERIRIKGSDHRGETSHNLSERRRTLSESSPLEVGKLWYTSVRLLLSMLRCLPHLYWQSGVRLLLATGGGTSSQAVPSTEPDWPMFMHANGRIANAAAATAARVVLAVPALAESTIVSVIGPLLAVDGTSVASDPGMRLEQSDETARFTAIARPSLQLGVVQRVCMLETAARLVEEFADNATARAKAIFENYRDVDEVVVMDSMDSDVHTAELDITPNKASARVWLRRIEAVAIVHLTTKNDASARRADALISTAAGKLSHSRMRDAAFRLLRACAVLRWATAAHKAALCATKHAESGLSPSAALQAAGCLTDQSGLTRGSGSLSCTIFQKCLPKESTKFVDDFMSAITTATDMLSTARSMIAVGSMIRSADSSFNSTQNVPMCVLDESARARQERLCQWYKSRGIDDMPADDNVICWVAEVMSLLRSDADPMACNAVRRALTIGAAHALLSDISFEARNYDEHGSGNTGPGNVSGINLRFALCGLSALGPLRTENIDSNSSTDSDKDICTPALNGFDIAFDIFWNRADFVLHNLGQVQISSQPSMRVQTAQRDVEMACLCASPIMAAELAMSLRYQCHTAQLKTDIDGSKSWADALNALQIRILRCVCAAAWLGQEQRATVSATRRRLHSVLRDVCQSMPLLRQALEKRAVHDITHIMACVAIGAQSPEQFGNSQQRQHCFNWLFRAFPPLQTWKAQTGSEISVVSATERIHSSARLSAAWAAQSLAHLGLHAADALSEALLFKATCEAGCWGAYWSEYTENSSKIALEDENKGDAHVDDEPFVDPNTAFEHGPLAWVEEMEWRMHADSVENADAELLYYADDVDAASIGIAKLLLRAHSKDLVPCALRRALGGAAVAVPRVRPDIWLHNPNCHANESATTNSVLMVAIARSECWQHALDVQLSTSVTSPAETEAGNGTFAVMVPHVADANSIECIAHVKQGDDVGTFAAISATDHHTNVLVGMASIVSALRGLRPLPVGIESLPAIRHRRHRALRMLFAGGSAVVRGHLKNGTCDERVLSQRVIQMFEDLAHGGAGIESGNTAQKGSKKRLVARMALDGALVRQLGDGATQSVCDSVAHALSICDGATEPASDRSSNEPPLNAKLVCTCLSTALYDAPEGTRCQGETSPHLPPSPPSSVTVEAGALLTSWHAEILMLTPFIKYSAPYWAQLARREETKSINDAVNDANALVWQQASRVHQRASQIVWSVVPFLRALFEASTHTGAEYAAQTIQGNHSTQLRRTCCGTSRKELLQLMVDNDDMCHAPLILWRVLLQRSDHKADTAALPEDCTHPFARAVLAVLAIEALADTEAADTSAVTRPGHAVRTWLRTRILSMCYATAPGVTIAVLLHPMRPKTDTGSAAVPHVVRATQRAASALLLQALLGECCQVMQRAAGVGTDQALVAARARVTPLLRESGVGFVACAVASAQSSNTPSLLADWCKVLYWWRWIDNSSIDDDKGETTTSSLSQLLTAKGASLHHTQINLRVRWFDNDCGIDNDDEGRGRGSDKDKGGIDDEVNRCDSTEKGSMDTKVELYNVVQIFADSVRPVAPDWLRQSRSACLAFSRDACEELSSATVDMGSHTFEVDDAGLRCARYLALAHNIGRLGPGTDVKDSLVLHADWQLSAAQTAHDVLLQVADSYHREQNRGKSFALSQTLKTASMILEQLVIQADEKHCMAVRSLSIESATCLIITSARRRETWQKSNLMVFASTILHACNTQHGGGAGPNTGKDDTLHAVALFLLTVHDALQRAQHACDELRALAARAVTPGVLTSGRSNSKASLCEIIFEAQNNLDQVHEADIATTAAAKQLVKLRGVAAAAVAEGSAAINDVDTALLKLDLPAKLADEACALTHGAFQRSIDGDAVHLLAVDVLQEKAERVRNVRRDMLHLWTCARRSAEQEAKLAEDSKAKRAAEEKTRRDAQEQAKRDAEEEKWRAERAKAEAEMEASARQEAIEEAKRRSKWLAEKDTRLKDEAARKVGGNGEAKSTARVLPDSSNADPSITKQQSNRAFAIAQTRRRISTHASTSSLTREQSLPLSLAARAPALVPMVNATSVSAAQPAIVPGPTPAPAPAPVLTLAPVKRDGITDDSTDVDGDTPALVVPAFTSAPAPAPAQAPMHTLTPTPVPASTPAQAPGATPALVPAPASTPAPTPATAAADDTKGNVVHVDDVDDSDVGKGLFSSSDSDSDHGK